MKRRWLHRRQSVANWAVLYLTSWWLALMLDHIGWTDAAITVSGIGACVLIVAGAQWIADKVDARNAAADRRRWESHP